MVKVISLSEKAYSELKSLKMGSESFSDVISRLTVSSRRKSILELAGKLSGSKADWDKIEKELRDLRSSAKLRFVD